MPIRGGLFHRGSGSSLRNSQKKSSNQGVSLRKSKRLGSGGPKLAIFDDKIIEEQERLQQQIQQKQQQKKRVAFSNPNRSMSPIGKNENVDSTGFSKAELHDLEESFKLFDMYGEGYVEVGDLRGVLESLKQERQEEDDEDDTENQQFTMYQYPHLRTLLDRLSELSDEDTLNLEDYIQLMASTTISRSIMLETDGEGGGSQQEHFARVFQLFDTNNKGYITLKDLERIAVELGEHDMTKGELQEMIDRAVGGRSGGGENTNNGEKRVGMEEFERMMTMSLFPSN